MHFPSSTKARVGDSSAWFCFKTLIQSIFPTKIKGKTMPMGTLILPLIFKDYCHVGQSNISANELTKPELDTQKFTKYFLPKWTNYNRYLEGWHSYNHPQSSEKGLILSSWAKCYKTSAGTEGHPAKEDWEQDFFVALTNLRCVFLSLMAFLWYIILGRIWVKSQTLGVPSLCLNGPPMASPLFQELERKCRRANERYVCTT